MRGRSTFSAILIVAHLFTVNCWGPLGHRFVARLAQSQLTASANQWIGEYLPDNLSGDLSAMASWPDLILYADSNPTSYNHWQWSRDLHYINTPDWNCTYLPWRDCVHDRCVEGALKNYSRRLISNDCDYPDQQEALFFLVHFVGDVHQPLHCGFKNDFGGNSVKGFFLNSTNLTNLHAIWDDEIINTRLERYFQSDSNLYYNYLQSIMFNQTLSINESDNDYIKWIDESVNHVCTQVYLDDNFNRMNSSKNFTLGEDYFNRNYPLIEQRLTRAGLRLSILLNELSKNRSIPKMMPGTQALIISLCTALMVSIVLGLILYFLHQRMKPSFHLLPSEES